MTRRSLAIRLVLAAAILAFGSVARADCFTAYGTRQCSDCACAPYHRERGSGQQRVLTDEAGRILFGNIPASVRALNTTFVVYRDAPAGEDACAPAKTLYAGQVYQQTPTTSDGNCWATATDPSWVALGPCAVCY